MRIAVFSCSWLAPLALLAGCHQPAEGTPGPTPTVTDTGWFTTTRPLTEDCPGKVVETEPAAGDSTWFWRDHPHASVSVADESLYSAALYGPSGQEVPTTLTWADNELNFTLDFDGGLAADADHLLVITDCTGPVEIPFHTDVYGLPLEDGAATLRDKTWQLDLQHANWLEPEGLGPILALNFTTPVLVGVSFVSDPPDAVIDVIGAPGKVDTSGQLVQDLSGPTWNFPVTDFSESPYVHAASDSIELSYQGTVIPVTGFTFETTFAPDGTSLGGTMLTGTADTRELGSFVYQTGDEDAVCSLALTLGTQCTPCTDGEPYCLPMSVVDVTGTYVPGVVLEEQD